MFLFFIIFSFLLDLNLFKIKIGVKSNIKSNKDLEYFSTLTEDQIIHRISETEIDLGRKRKRLGENKAVLGIFEKELAKYIDTDTLLMSLKLSHDKDRLKSFLQNSTISDELFFKLLKMYSWSKEDFFENDDNRDVSAALILRFYQNIERNHNVQYATSGLMHLIVQTNREELIEAISELEPLQKSFDSDKKSANYNILSSIAIHVNAPKNVLKSFIKKSDSLILSAFT